MVWCQRLLWIVLPFAAVPAVSGATEDLSSALGATIAVICWALWVVVTISSLVPHPITLTIIRTVAPVSIPLALWVAVRDPDVWALTMLALAVAAGALALSGWVSDCFVNGGSYGDERRFALRVPTLYLAGPIPVIWALCVSGLIGGALLIGAGRTVFGIVALVVGAIVTRIAIPAFHALSRRWLVFVPAGMTLVDHHCLADPVHFPRSAIADVSPALVGTNATDLSGNAPGQALEIGLSRPIDAAVIEEGAGSADATADLVGLRAVVVTPVRVGAVVAEASRRGFGSR